MPDRKKKRPPLTPAQRRRRKRIERRRENRREEQQEQRRENRQQRRRRERRQERRELRDEKLLTPEQRRRRIKRLQEGKETPKQTRRIKELRQAGRTFAGRQVAKWSDLTPEQRAKVARRIQQADRLTEAQERWRMEILRASGRIGQLPKGAPPSRVPPLSPDKAENFEDLLTGEARDAFRLIMLEFERLGLGRDLAREVYDAVVNGITNVEMILDIVRLSDVYKKRFPGMAARGPNLPVISEGEYIDIERRYRQVMEEAGLPPGFYDSPQDFAKFIGNDVGPQEFQGRVDSARRVAQRIDPYQRQLLASFYGIGTGELTAYFLDRKVALPILQRHVEASGVAVYAKQAGMDAGRGLGAFGRLVDLGVTEEEARAGYGTAATLHESLDRVAGVYGESFGVRDAEEDVFLGDTDKRRRLSRMEQGTWSGSSRGATGRGDRSLSY